MPIKSLAVILALLMCTMFMAAGCYDDKASSSSAASSSSSSSASSSSMSNSIGTDSSMITNSNAPSSPSSSGVLPPSSSGSNSKAAPAMAAASAWQLRLVNAANHLPDDFDVATTPISGYENRLFDARAADSLQNMLSAAEAAGRQLYLVSAYRSVARQKALFERKTAAFAAEGFPQAEAEKQAAMWVARPGTSEHNLGLAADIVSADWYKTNSDLTADFEKTEEFTWLSQNAAEYGFILRYPNGKENITGVTYEPWHYRYVGVDAAREITKKGVTLEEYVGAKT